MRRIAICAALVILVGCGGDGDGEGNASEEPSAISSSAAEPTAEESAPVAVDGEQLDAADLCAFLDEEAPRIEDIGRTDAAFALLAGDLALWISEHPGQQPRASAEFDVATEDECPDTRDRILEAIGKDSFEQALSGR